MHPNPLSLAMGRSLLSGFQAAFPAVTAATKRAAEAAREGSPDARTADGTAVEFKTRIPGVIVVGTPKRHDQHTQAALLAGFQPAACDPDMTQAEHREWEQVAEQFTNAGVPMSADRLRDIAGSFQTPSRRWTSEEVTRTFAALSAPGPKRRRWIPGFNGGPARFTYE